jgi:hypothetical protein
MTAMTRCRFHLIRAMIAVACLVGSGRILSAQSVEIAPIAGYRFGGDFFELISGRPVDLDGAPAVGGVVNVPISNGLQFEGLFTHQHAHVVVPARPFSPATRWRMSVDHWQAGGLQEFGRERLRPFLTGTLGLTRYAAEGDNHIRFTLGAGGGTKLFPTEHVGLRLDGRIFATFVDTEGSLLACSPGVCFLALHADIVWQAEFTAGVVFAFP